MYILQARRDILLRVCIKLLFLTKFDFTVDEGKERLNPSRDKNQGTHRRRKVD